MVHALDFEEDPEHDVAILHHIGGHKAAITELCVQSLGREHGEQCEGYITAAHPEKCSPSKYLQFVKDLTTVLSKNHEAAMNGKEKSRFIGLTTLCCQYEDLKKRLRAYMIMIFSKISVDHILVKIDGECYHLKTLSAEKKLYMELMDTHLLKDFENKTQIPTNIEHVKNQIKTLHDKDCDKVKKRALGLMKTSSGKKRQGNYHGMVLPATVSNVSPTAH